MRVKAISEPRERREPRQPRERRQAEAGFTLVEVLVALFVMAEMTLAILLLFDFSNKLSRVQTNIADMQQSLRVAQYDAVRLVRMTGRGGLPDTPLTATPANAQASATLSSPAFAVRDNVPNGAVIGAAGSPTVVQGTDVLTIRGVFSNPVYQVVPSASAFTYNTATGQGTITISTSVPTPQNGTPIPQHLDALATAVQTSVPEALVLVSGTSDQIYAVVELDPASSNVANAATTGVTIAFRTTGGTRTAAYNALSPGGAFPATTMKSVATVGILEEYRIYVRSFSNNPPSGTATDADKAAALNSKLTRARMFPNSDDAYGSGNATANAPNLSLDVADDVTDFQVALGFDTPQGGGSISGSTPPVNLVDTGDAADDWLFNSKADLPINLATWNNMPLYYIRLNTLVRTDRPDPKYLAPLLVGIEDRPYNGAQSDSWSQAFNQGHSQMFRRRLLQTIVDMRNLG